MPIASFLTSRTHTHVYDGGLALRWTTDVVYVSGGPHGFHYNFANVSSDTANIQVGSTDGLVPFCILTNSWPVFTPVSVGTVSPYDLGNKVSVQILTDSPVTNTTHTTGSSPPATIAMGGPGSWRCTFNTEEVCEIDFLQTYYPMDVTTIGSVAFPNFGGTAFGDSVPATMCRFYERLVLGSNISATFTVGDSSATANHTVTAGDQTSYLPTYNFFVDLTSGQGYSGGHTSFVQTNFNSLGVGCTYNPSNAHLSVNCDNGPSVTSDASDGGHHNAEVHYSANPPVQYAFDLRARAFGQPFPSSLFLSLQQRAVAGSPVVDTVILGPNYTGTVTQNYYQVYAVLDTVTQTGTTANEICPIRMWLKYWPSPHDDTRDWRCQMLGKPYTFGTQGPQAASLAVTNAATLASPGGALTVTQHNWEGYRFYQFTADQPGTLTIANAAGLTKVYNWTVTTPGTSQPITINLCSPSSWSPGALPNPDNRDSRFPLVAGSTSATGGDPDEATPANPAKGANWGVFRATTATISNVPATTTLHMGAGSLIRQNYSHAYYLPKFLPDAPGWDGPTTTGHIALQSSDGKLVADWPAMETLSTGNYQYETLTTLAAMLNYIPGWPFTLAGSFPTDGWHNASGYAAWAFGSGAVKRAGAWTDAWPIDATIAQTIYAQPLYDQVQGYPGIGDCWESAGYSGYAMPVNMSKSLRGEAWGLCLDNATGDPEAGAVVTTQLHSPVIATGTGTADSIGAYETGASYGFGNQSEDTAVPASTVLATDTQTWANRHARRETFRVGMTSAKGLCYDVSSGSQHARAYADSASGHIWVGLSSNQTPDAFHDVDSGVTSTYARIRWRDLGVDDAIGMIWSESPNVKFGRSLDGGNSFTVAGTLGAKGAYFDFDEGKNGLRYFYVVQDDGTGGGHTYNVYAEIWDLNDNVVLASVITNLTAIDNAPISVRESYSAAGIFRLGLLYSLGGNLNFKVSNDGVNFS